MFNRRTFQIAFAAALAQMATGPAQAQSVEQFYQGRTINMIISAAPGGASDFFARIFAPYFAKHLAGQPKIVVSNLPGASGITAALLLQQRGPFDGSTIALLQRNNFYAPLLDRKLPLRPRALNWLGSLNQEFYAVVARAGAPVQTWEDLLTTRVILGATSFGNENRTFAALMNDFMGAKFEIVTGYAGNSEIDIALERGEVQSRMQTVNSLIAGPEAEALAAGRIKLIAQIGISSAPQFPGLKNMMDLAVNAEAAAVARFLLTPLAAGRPFAAPPGVPAERLAALRAAFDAATADPEFLAEMKKRGSAIEAITGAEVQAIVEGLWNAPEAVLTQVQTLLNPPK